MEATTRSACLRRRIVNLDNERTVVRTIEQGIQGHRQRVHTDPQVHPVQQPALFDGSNNGTLIVQVDDAATQTS